MIMGGCEKDVVNLEGPEDDYAGSMTYDTCENTRGGEGHLRLIGSGKVHVLGKGSLLIRNQNEDIVIDYLDAVEQEFESGALLYTSIDTLDANVWAEGEATLDAQGVGFVEWSADEEDWSVEYVDD
tara:strand:+ start:1042 stop:1419 length:378 start_codon:yes stop_codon:yes gene_type:complete